MLDQEEIVRIFESLSTAHITDSCLRVQVPVCCAPAGTHAVIPGSRLAGRVLPARHAGSVDVFLEAFEQADPGDVLVVDNGGRLDEACVGDLAALEAQSAGLAGIVIWGLHRDTEHRQATRIQSGVTLRDQVQFALFLERRSSNPALSFREHLREVGGAIEE